jgi:hypothetical protein
MMARKSLSKLISLLLCFVFLFVYLVKAEPIYTLVIDQPSFSNWRCCVNLSQSFTFNASETGLGKIGFYYRKQGSPIGPGFWNLKNSSGVILASGSVPASEFQLGIGWYNITINVDLVIDELYNITFPGMYTADEVEVDIGWNLGDVYPGGSSEGLPAGDYTFRVWSTDLIDSCTPPGSGDWTILNGDACILNDLGTITGSLNISNGSLEIQSNGNLTVQGGFIYVYPSSNLTLLSGGIVQG